MNFANNKHIIKIMIKGEFIMTYKTHANFGVFFALLVLSNLCCLGRIGIVVSIIISAIVSLLPDIDHRRSFAGKILYPILCLIVLGIAFITVKYHIYILSFLVIWFAITSISSHRTFSHSIIGMIMFCIPFYDSILLLPVLLGYSSHLIADMITAGGVPLLYPFNKRRISILKLSVGSFSELILSVSLIILNALIFIANVLPLFV